jgi:hypothetical protein
VPESRKPRIRRLTVRLAGPVHRFVEEAAERQGVSLAQYVREAAIFRVAWEEGLRHADSPGVGDLMRELRVLGQRLELAESEDEDDDAWLESGPPAAS